MGWVSQLFSPSGYLYDPIIGRRIRHQGSSTGDESHYGEPRHPSQNAQRSFLPCVYVYFRRRENIDKKYYNCVLIESIGMEG